MNRYRLFVSVFMLFYSLMWMVGQKVVPLSQLEEVIKIDGVHELEVWRDIQPEIDFIQMQPAVGLAATCKSEVFIGQDAEKLYLSVLLYQQDPVIASIQSRDGLSSNDDSFLLILDTYNDGRSGYGFWVNPLGTQSDFRINDDGRNIDTNWDTEWEVAVGIEDDRWVVEMAIPFSSVRFKQLGSEWGINFGRIIRGNFEKVYWSGLLSDDFRISQGGKLVGIEIPEKQSSLSIFPFGTLKVENNEILGLKNDVRPSVGGDIKWKINPNITSDATINPDFATVEADQEEVNLTRYELSYPEKRLFFQEGNEMYDTRIKTFYSRRIEDILYGAKVNGKAGKYNFNGMNVRTLQRDADDEPPAYFSTVRVKRDFLESSSLGLSAVDKRNDSMYVTTFSGDYMLNLGKQWKLTGQLVASLPGDFLSHSAWFMRFSHESNVHHVHFRYTELGENFKENVNQTGYVTDDDRREVDADFTYRWWLNGDLFRYIYFESRNNMFWSRTQGDLRSWNFREGMEVYFDNKINIEYSYNNEYKLYEKAYHNHRHMYSLGYNTEEWNNVETEYSYGLNYDRSFRRFQVEAQMKLFNNFSLAYEADIVKFSPDTTNGSTIINVLNLRYNFTNNLWLELFGQTRSNTGKFYLYGKMAWRFKPPFGALYVIYSHDQDWVLSQRLDADVLFIKLTLPIYMK